MMHEASSIVASSEFV